ncbi:MAG: hypothetical protein ACREC6_05260, partial [Hyphomicrobiaceae bacterium]
MKLEKHEGGQLELQVYLPPLPSEQKDRGNAPVAKARRATKPRAKSKGKAQTLPRKQTPKATDTQKTVVSQWPVLREAGIQPRKHLSGRTTSIHAEAMQWIAGVPDNSIHAVVTDPPYGVIEYNEANHQKLRSGRGGVWRIPPSFDGAKRQPLPRFTVLSIQDRAALTAFFAEFAKEIVRILVPGGHVFIASNPLLSSQTFVTFEQAGFEKRGEVIRLVQTLRGGDRPKGAEKEFADVSMMARACWEPWGIFRKPLEGTAAQNLRKWRTGGLRRISEEE